MLILTPKMHLRNRWPCWKDVSRGPAHVLAQPPRLCQKAIYIYVYIYICCRVKNLSRFAFVKSKICPIVSRFFLCSLLFVFICFFLQGDWEKKNKKNKEEKIPFFESKICPTTLRNMLGQIFDSTLDRCLTQQVSHFWHIFPFSKYVETTML